MSQLTELIPQVAPAYHNLLVKSASAIAEDPYRDEILEEMSAIVKKAEDMLEMSKEASALGNFGRGIGMAGAMTAAAAKVPAQSGMRPSSEMAMGVAKSLGVLTVGGIALALAGDLYEAAKRGLTRGRDFKAMIEANPELGAPSKSARVKASFGTLHRFNPEFAKDPNVAGQYVTNSLEIPGTEYATAKDLVKARSDMQKPKELPGMGNLPSSIVYG